MNRRIDAYSLRLFVSTARVGSIVRGAALEHIAPSALSRVELKRPWRDGTTHLLFGPVEFLEKLAALTPRPEITLALYHVVLAPPRALAARRRRLSPHRG
jgi:hypothetical protein